MELTSIYKGGRTAKAVQVEIANRYGETEANNYDPSNNCFTYQGWNQRGFQVNKGEKGIKSHTFIGAKEKVSPKGIKITNGHKYLKKVTLFYHLQVSKKA